MWSTFRNSAFLKDCIIFPPLVQDVRLFGMEADLEAIQFSHFLGVIKAFAAQLVNNENKMSAVVAKIYGILFLSIYAHVCA